MRDEHRDEEAAFAHHFKTWPEPFQAVWEGRKPFEWRKDDREFRVEEGDAVTLREYDPETGRYSGRVVRATAGYVLRGDRFGFPAGYVVFGLVSVVREDAAGRTGKDAD